MKRDAIAQIPEIFCSRCTAKGGGAPVKRVFAWERSRQKTDDDMVEVILICGSCKTEKIVKINEVKYYKLSRKEVCAYIQPRYKNR